MPLLSILMPSIPERRDRFLVLWSKIQDQITACGAHSAVNAFPLITPAHKDGGLTIGEKRQALVDHASGDYICFVDDDDDVSNDYVASLLQACRKTDVHTGDKPDVVTFAARCSLPGCVDFLINMSLRNDENEEARPLLGDQPPYDLTKMAGIKRRPWHVCAWKRSLVAATHATFPPLMDAEDWPWCEAMLTQAKTEVHIDKILYHYRKR